MGKQKYSSEVKLEIVGKVLNGKLSKHEAAREYGVHFGDVQKWVAVYEHHGAAGLERERIPYPGEFKQSVVEDMRGNNLSMRETAAKYNIAIHSTISKWERIYIEEGPEGLYKENRGRSAKGRPAKLNKTAEEDLIAENQRLRMEVAYLKKLNALVLAKEKSAQKTKLR